MIVSIIVRTYNEQRHLPKLLQLVAAQELPAGVDVETIVVDSGSTDNTVSIAEASEATIVHIRKADFSFGRSLNVGCAASRGDLLVFVSAHCLPVNTRWVRAFVEEFRRGGCQYVGGRQVGYRTTKFSERMIFQKYYRPTNRLRQNIPFVNNANAAIKAELWREFHFDEALTGLEDLDLAKRITRAGYHVGYVPEAVVHHIHDETWRQVQRRYEREALAMSHIWPQIHFGFRDFVFHSIVSAGRDMMSALRMRKLARHMLEILKFRFHQYLGTWRGHRLHRVVTRRMKHRYYYSR